MNELSNRLMKMGWVFLGLAAFFSLLAYAWPTSPSASLFSLSAHEREPFYKVSGIFVAMSLFCFYKR